MTFEHDYRILFIEDDLDLTKLVQRMLVSWGAAVLCAATVEDATRLSAEQKFDLVLSDRYLPTGEAHEFLPQVLSTQADAAVIICSGEEDAEKFGFLGRRYRFVRKPFGPAALFAAVDAALRANRAVFSPRV